MAQVINNVETIRGIMELAEKAHQQTNEVISGLAREWAQRGVSDDPAEEIHEQLWCALGALTIVWAVNREGGEELLNSWCGFLDGTRRDQ